ncbi:hypothetical protein ACFO4P_06495 [Epilithonimonas pallida]|uniref:Restriction endonuclease type I HsdR N-terminal domain-containing protein n=1 Tax=Epilithonimonas pallida TaxID=373671 RepID=A0ABY1R6S7_9FLAO|nr:hypothetical protein [Epilithonimonas pallida]SMP96570.1 hypothetical protein SAMN05421679_109115 [Epilithonimonas pallida]
MDFSDNTFITKDGVYYPQIIREVKKSPNPLQPIYESFTNSLESIESITTPNYKGKVTLQCYFLKDLYGGLEFDKIIIEDNGKGFDDTEFNRFLTFKDSRKGFNNKGSGRIQFVHYFNDCEYTSTFQSGKGFKQRNFQISKSKNYIHTNNTLTFLKSTVDVDTDLTGTTLKLSGLIDDKDKINYLFQVEELKEKLLNHYIQRFCLIKENLPEITLEQYINEEFDKSVSITEDDIPSEDKTLPFEVDYYKLSLDSRTIEKANKKEAFSIKSFKIQKDKLSENAIKFISKNEIVELDKQKINLTSVSNKDNFEDHRFLFLVSSNYINDRDSDVRGELKIPTKDTFKKDFNIFQEEEIMLEDIEELSNGTIRDAYPEIQQKIEEKQQEIEELKEMFLLNDEVLKEISISLNDTEESILEKFYVAESRQIAKSDSRIKKQVDQLDNLDPTSKNYQEDLNLCINKLVKEIPLQNRKALTHYVARRKLVLDLFDKVLENKLTVQNGGERSKTEALIHNLIFKQHTENRTPDSSDLWLLNEDFILFEGCSESTLENVKVDGKKIFRDEQDLTEEERNFKNSLKEDRYGKRPDILLFPKEGKCVIIELKSTDAKVSDYINQIQNYATLIRNFSTDDFEFTTFYGYLFGEQIDTFDVRSKDSDFKEATFFDYLYRPAKPISGFFRHRKNQDGTIYTEIMKYSTLFARAKNRNDVFIKKLTQNFIIHDYTDDDKDLPF